MRILCRFGVVTALIALCAAPLAAQGKTGKSPGVFGKGGKAGVAPEQEPPKEPVNEAYYIVRVGGKDVGYGIMKIGADDSGNLQITFNGSAHVPALVGMDIEIPPSKSAEAQPAGVMVDYRDEVSLDSQGKLAACIRGRPGMSLEANYSQGRWTLSVKRAGETKTGTTPESPACDPPIPHLFFLLAKQGAFKPNAEIKKQVFEPLGDSLVGHKECTILVSASEKRVSFDGEERSFSRLLVNIKSPTEGKAAYESTVWVGEDGFMDELQYNGRIVFKRVKNKEALGALAGWDARNRRDIFEQGEAVRDTAIKRPDRVVDPADDPFKGDVAKVEAKIAALPGGTVKERVKKSQDIFKDIAKLRDKNPPDLVKKKLNELEAKVRLLVPPHELALAEATTLQESVFELLREDGTAKKGVEDAKKRLAELRALQLGPRIKGTPVEAEVAVLVSDCVKAIGKTVLQDYVRDVVVKGIIYRRGDVMEPVTMHLSILGAPVLLDDTIAVLHPRGLCLLNDEAYREGDPVIQAGKNTFAITVKEVFQDRVVLAGDEAEVDLKFTTEGQGGGKAPPGKSRRPR